MTKKQLELYIHIPFCVKKCEYCDFLSFPADEPAQRRYLIALLKEVEYYGMRTDGYRVSSIFIGGGTPSSINAEWIRRILDTVRRRYDLAEDAEITIECNPGTLTPQKLEIYKKAGVNRLSIGLQSTLDEELKTLGRIHTYEEFLESYRAARDAGFYNINIDLMSGLPYQTPEKFQKTLYEVIGLRPAHISVYSLIIEKGTPFWDHYQKDLALQKAGKRTKALPDEDTEYTIYKMTQRMLAEEGFAQYEISNYARPGWECRHNCGYWTGVDYLGIGLGASSYFEGYRFSNTSDMQKYLRLIPDLYMSAVDRSEKLGFMVMDQEKLDRLDEGKLLGQVHKELTRMDETSRMEEFMFLGLRMICGVSKEEFYRRFGKDMQEVYGEQLADLSEKELLIEEEDRVYLTERGLDLGNYCMAKFLLS